jgi:hypothetical protein
MVLPFAEKSIRCFMFLVLVMTGALFAVERCDLTFTGCPETFDGKTIVVPQNVVKMSSLVHACKASQTIHIGGTGGPASILFMIDNTGSMIGRNGNDPAGARFKVTRDLLDTIMKSIPNAEVGLIVFREHLFFDTTTHQFYYAKYFQPLTSVLDGEPWQAYLPFMTLNQTYDGKQGIDILKDILATNTAGDSLLYNPNYRNVRPNPNGGETNINGAFIGAKQAFLSAVNAKDQQYIIFLGDGEPAGSTQANLDPNYFTTQTGVVNVPTTFTVYFNSQGTRPPTLVTMTDNVKINGYSASNPKSNLWTITASYNSLMSVLMQNVISTILLSGNPTKMTLNSKTSTIYIDSSFFFTDSFPLTSDLTTFNMAITYRYVNPQTNILTDTVVSVTFSIQKSAQATTLPAGVTEICKDYPEIPGSVPVTATLLDTNHEGHLDRIDLTWTDTSAINPTMPTIQQLIKTLELTSLDGGKVTLTAVRIEPDLANKTIRVILQENTGPVLETGWQNASVVLTETPMTVRGGPFVVTNIVDGARPVIKSVCFVPTGGPDSLRVIFSEPVINLTPPLDEKTIFVLYTKAGKYQFTGSDYTVTKFNDMYVYAFTTTNLSNLDSLVEGNRPAFHLTLCGDVSIVQDSRVIGNPFTPGKTLVPGTGTTDLRPGTRVEVSLVPAIIANLTNGKVKGTVTIFDAVGNMVVEKSDLLPDLTNVKLYWIWDGRTRKGSMASAGTYLARIVIEDLEHGRKQNIRLNIGVKGIPK